DPLCPAHALNPAITPQVSAVLSQALALKRNDRPASAAEMRRLLRAAAQAAPPANSGRLQAGALPSTVMMQPEALAAQRAEASKAAQAQAANSEATAPQAASTAPEIKTAPASQQNAPPVVNMMPSQPVPQVATPHQPARKSRTGVWLVAGVGLIISLGLVIFVALAYYAATSQQQTTDSGSSNTTPVVNNNRSSQENSNTYSEQNSNSNNENADTGRPSNVYNANSTSNSNSNSSEVFTPTNPSDVHVQSLYMAASPDGDATTTFNSTDHTVYAIAELNKLAAGTQVRFSWIAVDVEGEEKGSKIKDIDYTTGAMENIVKAHLTLPQDWPTGQYKVEVYLNGNLEQTIEYTVE